MLPRSPLHPWVPALICFPLLLPTLPLPPIGRGGVASAASSGAMVRRPTRSECDAHAGEGLCDVRKYAPFMAEYCSPSCDELRKSRRNAEIQKEMRRPQPLHPFDVDGWEEEEEEDEEDEESEDDEEEEEEPPRFFKFVARDIDKERILFSEFLGKVTVVTNVASECGYTDSHYEGMVNLYNRFADTGMFNIVAFPCNQFGEQEPGTNKEIKEFAEGKGVEFIMMNKADVNGRRTHPLYRFLKTVAGPTEIEWNFGTYFVIGPDGHVQSFSGVEPEDLREVITELMSSRDEL